MDYLLKKDTENWNIIPLVKISGIAVILQLLSIIVGVVVTVGFASIPNSAIEYYQLMQESRLMGLLADDFFSLILVVLYLFTFTGLFFVVARNNFSLALLSTLFTFTAVILVITSHSGFSLIHLSDQYWANADEMVRSQLLAAGEAIISQNIWNSTAGFFSGILLQGGGVLISIAMVGSKSFGKITIYSGILANGLDLVQHLIHYSSPSMAEMILYLAGPFYIIWYIMLARDLFNCIKVMNKRKSDLSLINA